MTSPHGYQCPTVCDPDCTSSCHERHRPHSDRRHDPDECDQRQLGRDVTPLAPPENPRLRLQPPPPKVSRGAYAGALSEAGVSWWRRLALVVRGPRD